MTIGKKISLVCAFLVTLTAILASIALLRVSDIEAKLLSVTDRSLPGVYSVGKLAQLNRVMTGNMLLHLGVPSARQAMETKIRTSQGQFTALLGEFGKSITTPEEKQLYDAIPPVYRQLCNTWEKIRPISNAGDSVTAWKIWIDEGRPALLDLEQKLNAEIDFSRTVGSHNAEATIESVHSAQVWILVVLALAIVSGVGWTLRIVQGLNRQLRKTALDLSSGAAEVASAAAQVASSSQALAQGASEQAASLEETTASTQEITARTRRNAENSRSASDAISAMGSQVDEGNRNLDDMLTSMAEIKGSSNKVSNIIKTIDEIAFQTNILALNAAVEAARAGEAGLGFAVVADEVRNLAQRSAHAARETAALIEESVTKSGEGASKVEHVARIIRTITDSTGKVKALVDEVHQGSKEQIRGIEQIARAIVQMDQVTQSNAASAEESAAASQQLSAQAVGLQNVASVLGDLVGSNHSTPLRDEPQEA